MFNQKPAPEENLATGQPNEVEERIKGLQRVIAQKDQAVASAERAAQEAMSAAAEKEREAARLKLEMEPLNIAKTKAEEEAEKLRAALAERDTKDKIRAAIVGASGGLDLLPFFEAGVFTPKDPEDVETKIAAFRATIEGITKKGVNRALEGATPPPPTPDVSKETKEELYAWLTDVKNTNSPEFKAKQNLYFDSLRKA